MNDCIFCKMVSGEMSYHKVWEDKEHLAFLSIFPNTLGCAVVIPKAHYPSYVFAAPDDVVAKLMVAARKTANILDKGLDDVGRTGVIYEGFGVDHLHAKLFPMHGTKDMARWKRIENPRTEYYDVYPGYLSSHDSDRASDDELSKLAKKLRSA